MEIDSDSIENLPFSSKQQAHTAFMTLAGMLDGITSDVEVAVKEARAITDYMDQRPIFSREPFADIKHMFMDCVEDGIITPDEKNALLDFCFMAVKGNDYYDAISSEMQVLQGIVAGIAADGIINKEEARHLESWLAKSEQLRGMWPYDELEALLLRFLEDDMITQSESDQLIAFVQQWVPTEGQPNALAVADLPRVDAVLAIAPEIEFPQRTFCFTGKFADHRRSELHDLTAELSGIPTKAVGPNLDYLVVGSQGNPCYTFSCYGRKVEQAMKCRKKGARLLLVSELDFLDCAQG